MLYMIVYIYMKLNRSLLLLILHYTIKIMSLQDIIASYASRGEVRIGYNPTVKNEV